VQVRILTLATKCRSIAIHGQVSDSPNGGIDGRDGDLADLARMRSAYRVWENRERAYNVDRSPDYSTAGWRIRSARVL
jgi:hypothetical protein